MTAKARRIHLGLRFSDLDLEREFLASYNSQFIPQARAAMALGVCLIFIDAFVDYLTAPAATLSGNLIRILVCNSLFATIIASSYIRIFQANFQTYVSVLFSIGSVFLLYAVETIANAGAPTIVSWVGVVNYFFAIIFVFLIMGLRLGAGAVGGAVITIAYLAIIAIFKDLTVAELVYSAYQIITIYVLGAFLGFVREFYVRRDFATQRELRDGQESLRVAKEAAERGDRAKSEFLATMSHELRTPLNGILGVARLALGKQEVRGDLRAMLETIEKSGGTLRKLIDDVLDITRIEAGQLLAAREAFSLPDLLEEVVRIVQPLAVENATEIEVKIDREVPAWIEAELAHLRQVLLNLLGNAVKFTRQGKIAVSVVGTREEAGGVRLRFAIADTGIGIPADQLDKIFEPLTQASNTIAGRYGGTGLGLAIVKRLVAAMGGRISVESALGKGSKFTFDILVNAAGALEVDVEPHVAAGRAAERLRLLLVEDDAVNQQVATGFLELAGHEVLVAQTGAEAIEMATTHHFDAVLMDVRLPDMTGLAAMEAIRNSEVGSAKPAPIIAVTANVMPGEVQRYLAAGMAAVVAKPIDPHKLHAGNYSPYAR